jgi:hypothetical protein
MKLIKFLEREDIATKETAKIFLASCAAYAFSLWLLHVRHYISELAFLLLTIGGMANLYVITFNGNKMPVAAGPRTVGRMRKKYPKRGICKLTHRTKLAWLADRFITWFRGRPLYWSVGDLVVAAGVVFMFVGAFTKS